MLSCHAGHVVVAVGMRFHRPAALDGRLGWSPAGPLPGRLCSLLFGEAQADVVNLNCFLIRLSPFPGWVSSLGTLVASLGPLPLPGIWPRTGRSQSGCAWGCRLDAVAAPQHPPVVGGTGDGALLRLPLIVGAEWEESGTSPCRNPGALLGLGGPWGPTLFWWVWPFIAGCPAPASESPESLFKKFSPSHAALVTHGGRFACPLPRGTFGVVCRRFRLPQLELCSLQDAAIPPAKLRTALGGGERQNYLVQGMTSAEVEKPRPYGAYSLQGRGWGDFVFTRD